MNITRAAIAKNRLTYVILVLLLVSGWRAFWSLPRQEDPGFTIRIAQVTTLFPGASPERVEKLVTDRLEKAILEIPELHFVSSVSKTGLSVITVNIQERYRNMRPIWDTLRRKIERESVHLPQGVLPPRVNDEFGDVFGIILGVTGDGYSYAQLKETADSMRDELLLLPDVAKVQIYGEQEERVFIEYRAARLAEVGLSPLQLSQMLRAQNILTPGGNVLVDDERITLEPSGSFTSVAQVGNTVITLPKSRAVVLLRDIAAVRRGYIDPPQSKTHTSFGTTLLRWKKYRFPHEKPATAALALGISMRDGGRLTELGKQVEDQIQRFNAAYPIGIQVEKAIFQPTDVQNVINDFTSSLAQAIGIVMLTMLLFLGLRTGLVVAALIPVAIVCSLLLMQIFGIGLNQISLAALIIALGMLVDNGVVMAEATMVEMAAGKDATAAAIASAGEMRTPLLTSSLTTAAAFLPIYLAQSTTGEYTAALFQVVTIALLCSWLLSITMTPLLCSSLLRVKPVDESQRFGTRFYRGYRRFLLFFLRRRLIAGLLIVGAFVAAMAAFRLVPAMFFPPSDRPTFEVVVKMRDSSDIHATRRVVEAIEAEISAKHQVAAGSDASGVVRWVSFIGQGAPRYYLSANPEPPNPGFAQLLVTQTDRASMDQTIADLDAFCRSTLPQANVELKPRALGPPVRYPIEVRISGTDTDRIFRIVEQLKTELRQSPGVNQVSDNWGIRSKKLAVVIDQARAQRAGITNQDVAVSLQTHFSGLTVTEYREGEDVIPVTMRSTLADRRDLGKLDTVSVYSQATGRSVPLRQLAEIKLLWEPSKLLHRDRVRTVAVNATLRPGVLAAPLNKKVKTWLASQARAWPLSYRYAVAGEAEESEKANASINEQLPVAAFVIIILLIWQFNSLRRAAIILVTLPLGLIGVVIGLLAAQSYFGFMTFLGVISLFGIVINNAIVLIDRIDIEIRDLGREPAEAIMNAAQQRLRPILLTTATTIAGLLPLWFGGSPMFQPMAIAIIFGLGFATVLTLGAVPLFYSLAFRVSFRAYGR
ncbi:MAG: efflux RND transporter permease subunit [Deltaproteobacteria bacterium]|nr:efflux RND transporter permease subunit [Deltaproteobacteria bacterium]